ncbi:hypothetical protein ACWGF2_13275 [Streptomyces sp. NPDC054919]
MERSEAIRTISAIAADQWGLVTTAQSEAAGVSRVDLGRIEVQPLARQLADDPRLGERAGRLGLYTAVIDSVAVSTRDGQQMFATSGGTAARRFSIAVAESAYGRPLSVG